MSKDKVKCTMILGDETNQKQVTIGNDEIIKSFYTTFSDSLEGYVCRDFVRDNLHIQKIIFNCDMTVNINRNLNLDGYEGDADYYSDYIDEQLRKINILSDRQEVQAITECVTQDMDEILDFIIKREYRFFPKDSKEFIAQLLYDSMQNADCEKRLNEEGVYLTSTGILFLVNKPQQTATDGLLDKNEIQLDVHFVKENGNDSEWVHFPMSEKEITRFMGKYRGVDSYIIDETSSNCGLGLYTRVSISPLEEYVLQIQSRMEQLNKMSTVEEVTAYSKKVINVTPFNADDMYL